MNLDQRLHSFLILSEKLKLLDATQREALYSKAYIYNPWFIKENVDLAFNGLFRFLQKDKLEKWLKSYKNRLENPKTIGVVMAGNIPMVGIHDFLAVLISGHKLQAKLSAKDEVLIRYVSGLLCEIEPTFADYIQFVDKLQGYDAVIATGSDNTARYFEYYFSNVLHIIRKNRTSIGILSGDEKPDDYELLADDIFQYFGLGCRNISKIYLPEKIKPETLTPAFRKYAGVIDHNKYANNYYYNRSIFLVNQISHLDTGFLLMQENMDLASPLSVLYYEYYKSAKDLEFRLGNIMDKIQCSVSKNGWYADSSHFGTAQKPEVWEYADHVDTMDFLLNL
jgi:hypothetical protein